jgi:glutathione peroxidase
MTNQVTPVSIYEITVNDIHGQPVSLADFRGKVMLIVNTASKCACTPQYQGLQKLHDDYAAEGLVVMGFPCNQFGAQEPGDSAEIRSFCQINYKIAFPMFAKLEVNGENSHPLFAFLKRSAPGLLGTETIKWNFTKFLVDRRGNVVHRYAPITKPEELVADIEKLLKSET